MLTLLQQYNAYRITLKPISGTVSSDDDSIAQEMSVCQGLTFLFQISVQYGDQLGFQIIITSLQKSMWHVCQILFTDKELLTIMDWGQTVTKKVLPYPVIVWMLYCYSLKTMINKMTNLWFWTVPRKVAFFITVVTSDLFLGVIPGHTRSLL